MDQAPVPDEDRLRALGDALASETAYLSQFSYQLYDTTGTTDDYIYGALGGFSYTPEIGKTEFHPAFTTGFIPEYDGQPETDRFGKPTGRMLGGLRRRTRSRASVIDAGPTAARPSRAPHPAGRTLRIARTAIVHDERQAGRRRQPVPAADPCRAAQHDARRRAGRDVHVGRQPVEPAERRRDAVDADVRGRRGQRARDPAGLRRPQPGRERWRSPAPRARGPATRRCRARAATCRPASSRPASRAARAAGSASRSRGPRVRAG